MGNAIIARKRRNEESSADATVSATPPFLAVSASVPRGGEEGDRDLMGSWNSTKREMSQAHSIRKCRRRALKRGKTIDRDANGKYLDMIELCSRTIRRSGAHYLIAQKMPVQPSLPARRDMQS